MIVLKKEIGRKMGEECSTAWKAPAKAEGAACSLSGVQGELC